MPQNKHFLFKQEELGHIKKLPDKARLKPNRTKPNPAVPCEASGAIEGVICKGLR